MKKFIYIMVSVAMLAAIQACDKQPVESPDTNSDYITLKFTPKYDLDVDVKSIEIGKTDIWCYFFDWGTSEWTGPVKQREINGSTYSYQLPKVWSANVYFLVMPEELLSHMNLENPNEIHLDYSLMSLDKVDIYMSEGSDYHDPYGFGCSGTHIWGLDSGDISLNLSMSPRYRKTRLMINFIDVPSSVNIEEVIDRIYPSFRNIPLDGGIEFKEMEIEKLDDTWEGETTWYTKDIYTIITRRINNQYYYLTLKFETKDKKIFETKEIYMNYDSLNDEARITIDYDYLTKNK